jgi:katanin p80 WD40 repeat-containing subunit B1
MISHPFSSVLIAESRVRGSNLTPSSTDKMKKDRSSSIPRRPDSSFKSSVQSATPMRRMKLADSPSTNPRTVEHNSGQRNASLTSCTGITNGSLTTRKCHFTESAPVTDIYTTSETISAPVLVPRDILEDKTIGSVPRRTSAVPEDFRDPAHTRKFSSDASDSDASVTSMLDKSDACSEGLSGLKFSFGLTPYYKKEEDGSVDKGHITQMADHMDRAMTLEHPVWSSDDKCITLFLCL